MGNLSQYLDIEDGSDHVLEWSKRVSIIKSIAKGIGYMHSNEASKATIVHQNISVEKILLDHQFKPLIMDAGLPKLLADDVVFSALKVSAAMGYLAPEYITTGRFTEKSDIYAFGVIVLQVLSGKKAIGSSIRMAVESFTFDESVDTNLRGRYSKSEAETLSKLAIQCTHEHPDQRPTMVDVIQELSFIVNRRDSCGNEISISTILVVLHDTRFTIAQTVDLQPVIASFVRVLVGSLSLFSVRPPLPLSVDLSLSPLSVALPLSLPLSVDLFFSLSVGPLSLTLSPLFLSAV
ncbi:hypothetical protein RJT34_22363 [Clitoria ternatea]|uniref:Protein kinase domain-containing protein n=1 Tax=Clitoria ternatea TaxID=43366 RepID=A0AAN9IW12_CLITE